MKYIITESQLDRVIGESDGTLGGLKNFVPKKPKRDLSPYEGEVSDGLKKIIFNELSRKLSDVEFFECSDGIWVIDKQNDWYLRTNEHGFLLYNYDDFFKSFFRLFSLGYANSRQIIERYGKEVLGLTFQDVHEGSDLDQNAEKVRSYCKRKTRIS
jgi:hypothetical protein